MINNLLFCFLPLQLFLAPMVLGGNRPWVHGVLAVLAFGTLLLSMCAWATGKVKPRLEKPQWVFLAALAGVAVFLEIQGSAAIGWSVNKANTLQHANVAWVYFAFSASCVLLINSREKMHALVWALVITGFAQALLGIALFSSNASYLLHGELITHPVVKGAFVGRNNFAALINICLCAGIGLLLYQIAGTQAAPGEGFKRLVRATSLFFLSAKAPLRVMLMVMVIALIASRSRAANSLFFGATLAIGLIALWVFKKGTPSAKNGVRVLFITVLVFDVLVLGTLVGLDKLIDRMEQTRVAVVAEQTTSKDDAGDDPNAYSDSLQGRVAPALNGLNAFLERPLLGWGGKTFEFVFTKFEDASSTVEHYEHAHSDLIEILIEFGLVGLLIFGFALLVPLREGIAMLINTDRRIKARGLQLGLVFASLVTIGHSVVDFPLQVFGVVLPFVAVLNLLMISKLPTHERTRSRIHRA